MFVISLVTRGLPTQTTGGHLYHRRMATAAPARGARIEFVPSILGRNPLRHAGGVVLIDSLAAWTVAPWLRSRSSVQPMAAILHQPPGGIDHAAARKVWQRRMDIAVYRRCEVLIVAAAALADEVVAETRVASERIRVIEPGSDLPAPPPTVPDLRRGRRMALLCVANWLPNKGVVELLDGVAGLPGDDVTLHLAGRDDVDRRYTARVRARLAATDLAARVVVHGCVPLDEMAALYSGADAFALLSRHETYGTAYGEALRAGLPTLGWNSGNLPHLIDDGREGCLLEPGDMRGLHAALTLLATDEGRRKELGAAAQRRGRRLPTWEDAANQFFDALAPLTADLE